MKIAQLTPYFYPHTGGTEKYVKDLSEALVERGHEVTVISCNVPIKAHAPAEEISHGVKIKRLPAIDTIYLPITWKFNVQLLEEFDVVHSHVPAFGFARAVAGKVKIPHVVTYHCDVTASERFLGLPVPHLFIGGLEEWGNRAARAVLPKVDAIISTTESYARTSPVLKDFPHRVVPIGMHFERFDEIVRKDGISEESRRRYQVLFVGRLAANKGVNYLIQAIPKVLESFPQTQFIIVGEGEEKRSLVALIKRLGVEEAVAFYGRVLLPILANLYATSTLFVLPSINRLEAFGIVQLEAMACSTPVVVSDIPGVKDVPGPSGLLVPPRNPQALAEAMLEILSNWERGRQMGRRGRELIEKKYNWSIIAEHIEGIYRKLLEARR